MDEFQSDLNTKCLIRLKANLDLKKLRREVIDLTNRFPIRKINREEKSGKNAIHGEPRGDVRMLNLKGLPGNVDFYSGTSLDLIHDGKAHEHLYTDWHEELQGSYIQEIVENFPINIGRARLLELTELDMQHFHVDLTPVITIPIFTHWKCMFAWAKPKGLSYMVHLPADGNAYFLNTSINHTALNAGVPNRIHLTLHCVDSDWELQKQLLLDWNAM